jgi:hypothetical protein
LRAVLIAKKQKYANRYGEIIQNLDSYRKKSTIPGTGKVILGIIFIATFVFVFFSPKLRPHLASYLFIAVPLILADMFGFFRSQGWGYGLWNFVGPFGHARDAKFEQMDGCLVDRELLEILKG